MNECNHNNLIIKRLEDGNDLLKTMIKNFEADMGNSSDELRLDQYLNSELNRSTTQIYYFRVYSRVQKFMSNIHIVKGSFVSIPQVLGN